MLLRQLRRHDPARPDPRRLWKQLAADDPATKVTAREELVAAGVAAVPMLVDVLSGPNRPLAGNTSWHSKARHILNLMPAAEEVPALLALREDGDPNRRAVVEDLLLHAAARDPATARAIATAGFDLVGRLVQLLATEAHPGWVVRALLNTGGPGAVEACLNELGHVAGHDRFLAVARAIAESGDERTDASVEAALTRRANLMDLDVDVATLAPGPAPAALVRKLNEQAARVGSALRVLPGAILSRDGTDLALPAGGDRLLLRAGPPRKLDDTPDPDEAATLEVVLADGSRRLADVREAMLLRGRH